MDAHDSLTPLDPAYLTLLRLRIAAFGVALFAAALVLEVPGIAPRGAFAVPALLLAAVLAWRLPARRYGAAGYRIAEDRLDVVQGPWLRRESAVPFGRVQHIDLAQGPLERRFGLATLMLHTAGVHGATVSLPGLPEAQAYSIREAIRSAIRRDTQ